MSIALVTANKRYVHVHKHIHLDWIGTQLKCGKEVCHLDPQLHELNITTYR
jgi:hypothetical protein